jgi:serine protease Do
MEYQLALSRFAVPKATRIEGMDSQLGKRPEIIPQLAELPQQFAVLESGLDDACCLISSRQGGETLKVVGTHIANSSLVVSKSSMVGSAPQVVVDDQIQTAQILARDDAQDLVLLKLSSHRAAGVNLDISENQPRLGQLLLTPDPNGPGFTSVVGSTTFSSQRQASKGYLGVVLTDFQPEGVVLETVDEGAAQRAGLRAGDVILKMNDVPISNQPTIKRFLASVNPKTIIKAKVRRETTEFDAEILLEAPPNNSDHAADMMEKSLRRDGFDTVFSHDAALHPDTCGGPVFTLTGKFAGINVARHSRVRAFTIPPDRVKQFVDQHR